MTWKQEIPNLQNLSGTAPSTFRHGCVLLSAMVRLDSWPIGSQYHTFDFSTKSVIFTMELLRFFPHTIFVKKKESLQDFQNILNIQGNKFVKVKTENRLYLPACMTFCSLHTFQQHSFKALLLQYNTIFPGGDIVVSQSWCGEFSRILPSPSTRKSSYWSSKFISITRGWLRFIAKLFFHH